MAGGRKLAKGAAKKEAGKPGLPGPLVERTAGAEQKAGKASMERLFALVDGLEKERRRQQEALREAEAAVKKMYHEFSPKQRVEFFAMLYDRLAENYDAHMERTGHYAAIERLLGYASYYLRFPIVDLTAGTGEPLRHALGFISGNGEGIDAGLRYVTHVNEISQKSLEKAKGKLAGYEKINFTGFDAYRLPAHLRGRFRTVLCSQTFHLIADEDKGRLVRSMHRALAPGGIAVVLEEDPFMITPTPEIDVVSIFIRSIAAPILPRTLIGCFENVGFQRLEARAVWPIDEKHSMRLHLFQKS